MELKALIAIVVVILLVVGINGALFLMMRRGKSNKNIQLWQKAARSVRNPWQVEDENLQELSNLVDKLKPPEDPDQDQ